MINLTFVKQDFIKKIINLKEDRILRAEILSTILRINTLSMIEEASSGHVGTSFSCMDILTWLWFQDLKNVNERNSENGDVFFSSKGHDVPALYAVLIALGRLEEDSIHTLRKLHGLPGHPDVHTPGIAANTGSLGMGISKARGMAIANRLHGIKKRIFVVLGDGELEEGQIWESLQSVANGKFSEITVIVDHNKIQSDTWVKETSDLGDLQKKFEAFGWHTQRCNGHNFIELEEKIRNCESVLEKPHIIIADTIKGCGVSFMEQMSVVDGAELYKFHSGAPSEQQYGDAIKELISQLNEKLKPTSFVVEFEKKEISSRVPTQNQERLIAAYSDELLNIGKEKQDVVVLDADLALDTGTLPFKKMFKDRFIECGIAEQDMVSVAGGLALNHVVPIVHSFACFLSTRPNEQIYNNATEKTKIVYVGSLAGLLPAVPGHSHQSVRDISTLGSIPGLTILEPCNEQETRLVIRWAVETNQESTYIRLVSVPCAISYSLPKNYTLQKGVGVQLADGLDAAIIAYGPVLLTEAVAAVAILKEKGISVAVYNLPWLNEINNEWFLSELDRFPLLFSLDDHYHRFGQGYLLSSTLCELNNVKDSKKKIYTFGIEDVPQCGQPKEILSYHGLDAVSIARKILEIVSGVSDKKISY